MAESSTRLYPDLGESAMDTDDDILAALNAPPKSKRPPRPPPPTHTASEGEVGSLQFAITGVEPRRQSAPATSSGLVPQELSSVIVPYPLLPTEVRWFYQEPGKFWQAFSGYDSLALEEAHLRQQERGVSEGDVMVMGELHEVNVGDRTCRAIYWTVKEPWKVLRGYWYEVIGEKWYPVPEIEYVQIESEHVQRKWREKAMADAQLQSWAESGKPSQKQAKENASQPLNSVIVNKLTVDKYEVWWMGGGDIYKMKKEMSTQFLNKVGEKFGKGQLVGATKLVRGYKESAVWVERLSPIGHLVFVIHGIGQNMDLSDISKSTSDFRDTCTQVAKRNFSQQWKEKRVEFLPVEWRTWLSLDKGMLKMITPHGVPRLRELMNDSALDILYYMSPKFGPEILDGLKFSLHKQYSEFTKRHPDFISSGGTVSIVAHSLGSVMTYDLLQKTCVSRGIDHSDPASSDDSKTPCSGAVKVTIDEGVRFKAGLGSPEPGGAMEDEQTDGLSEEMVAWRELTQLKERVAELEQQLGIGEKHKNEGLHFTVDHFFAVGSPLAVFIMMREHETLVKKNHRSAASILPTCICKRIHNLHHPSDPVAYRLEPLINECYAQIKPVKVDSASGKPSQEAVGHAGGIQVDCKPQTQSKGWFSSLFSSSSKDTIKTKPPPDKVLDSDKTLRSKVKLRERLDFMLRENLTDISYVNSLTAHTCYWTSQDCAQYVLLQLYNYKTCAEAAGDKS